MGALSFAKIAPSRAGVTQLAECLQRIPLRIAEGIRVDLEAVSIEAGTEKPLRVTVSAGCAQVGAARDIATALTLADVWLSQAKRAGRNQVIGL